MNFNEERASSKMTENEVVTGVLPGYKDKIKV
jgi:hypothetical protein